MRTSDELIGHIIAEILPEHFAKYDGCLINIATDYSSTTDCCMMDKDGHLYQMHEVVLLGRWPDAQKLMENNDQGRKQIRVDLTRSITLLLIDYLYGKTLSFSNFDEAVELFTFAVKCNLNDLVDEYAETVSGLLTPQNFLNAYHIKIPSFFSFVHSYATYNLVDAYYKHEQIRTTFHDLEIQDVKFLLGDYTLQTSDETLIFTMIKAWMVANDSINRASMEILIGTLFYNKYNFKKIHELMKEFTREHNLPPVTQALSRRRIPRNALVFFGLYNNKNPLSYYVDIEKKSIIRFSRLDSYQFVQVPHFISVGGTITQVGGATDTAIAFAKADCFKFDTKLLRWKRISSLPFERVHPAICSSSDGAIYHVGGHSQELTSKIKHGEIYIPSLNTWKPLPKLIVGRYKAAAVHLMGRVIVTGGKNEDGWLDSVEILSRLANRWINISPMTVARSEHQMVSYKERIYVLGGKNSNGNLKEVESIDQDLNGSWQDIPNMTYKRGNFAAEVFDNKIFVFGGEYPVANGRPLTVEFFDGIKWNSFCTLPANVLPLSAIGFLNIPKPETLLFEVVNGQKRAKLPDLSRKRPFSCISK